MRGEPGGNGSTGVGSFTAVAWVATAAVVLGTTLSGARDDTCPRDDREALLVGALHSEANTAQWQHRTSCVVLGLGEEGLADPPARVLIRLRRILHFRVVPVSEAIKCASAPRIWVAEPVCNGNRAHVRTQTNHHCPLLYRRVGARWESEVSGVCE
jgi:hypothetical protein